MRRAVFGIPWRITMDATSAVRVLIVANRTAASPLLLGALRARARQGECSFTLLVPRLGGDVDPEGAHAEVAIRVAVPAIQEATGCAVVGVVGDPDPFTAVRDFLIGEQIDEVIISTLPERLSRWLRWEIPSRVRALGVPVTVVTARHSDRAAGGV
jgi:hypothetical protein